MIGGRVVHVSILFPQHLIEHEHPNVHQQRAQEALLLLHDVQFAGQQPRRSGRIDAAPPVIDVLEALGFCLG